MNPNRCTLCDTQLDDQLYCRNCQVFPLGQPEHLRLGQHDGAPEVIELVGGPLDGSVMNVEPGTRIVGVTVSGHKVSNRPAVKVIVTPLDEIRELEKTIVRLHGLAELHALRKEVDLIHKRLDNTGPDPYEIEVIGFEDACNLKILTDHLDLWGFVRQALGDLDPRTRYARQHVALHFDAGNTARHLLQTFYQLDPDTRALFEEFNKPNT